MEFVFSIIYYYRNPHGNSCISITSKTIPFPRETAALKNRSVYVIDIVHNCSDMTTNDV